MKCSIATKPCNLCKNRYLNVLPKDSSIPKLVHAGYVNASLIADLYLITQTPMENTTEDFWVMANELAIVKAVMLVDSSKRCSLHLPDNVGDSMFFSRTSTRVSCVRKRITEGVVMRVILVDAPFGSTMMEHYQRSNWDGTMTVPLAFVLENVNTYYKDPPVMVYCESGAHASMMFVAVSEWVHGSVDLTPRELIDWLGKYRIYIPIASNGTSVYTPRLEYFRFCV
jgi:protein tyrosine phosphatase